MESGLGGLFFGILIYGVLAVWIGYPLLSILLGYYFSRFLVSKGCGKHISIAFGIMVPLIFLFIPYWDYQQQKLLLNSYCTKEGGFQISQKVVGVDGVHNLRNAIDFGYMYGEYYEDHLDPKGLRRAYKASPGSKRGRFAVETTESISPYGLRRVRSHIEGAIYRTDLQTYVTATGQELGRYVYFQNIPTEENIPSEGRNISNPDYRLNLLLDVLRPWLRMSCSEIHEGNDIPFVRELLKETLQPVDIPGVRRK